MKRSLWHKFGLLLLAASAVCAQIRPETATSGDLSSIKGTVKDESGAAKPGASVELTDKAGNKQVEKADRYGEFTFKHLSPAPYVLAAQPGTKLEIDPVTTKFRNAMASPEFPHLVILEDEAGIVPAPQPDLGQRASATSNQPASAADDTLMASTESDAKKWLAGKASKHLVAIGIVGTSDGSSVVHFKRTNANVISTYVVQVSQAILSQSMQKVIDISGVALFVGIHQIDPNQWLLIFRQ